MKPKKLLFFCVLVAIFLPDWGFAKDVTLKDLWISLGFCESPTKEEQDYLQVKGKDIYGTYWRFKACQDINLSTIEETLKSRGFQIISKSDQVLFACYEDGSGKVYAKIRPADSEPLRILEQVILKPGKDLEISLPEEEKFYFYIDSPREAFLSMKVSVGQTDDEVSLEAYTSKKLGKLKTHVRYSRKIFGREGDAYLYDLPLVSGLTRWCLQGKKGVTVTLSLKKEGRLIPLAEKDKFGGIVLKNVPYGKAKALPETGAEYYHASLSEEASKGDLTPGGDTIFWLAPGYWQLKVEPFQKEQTSLSYLYARLIPVFPGYLTEVLWPASLGRALAQDDEISLEILRMGTQETRAYLDFSLLNLAKEKFEPSLAELEIYEAGAAAQPLEVKRLKTPLQVVILLDSSGSMKGSMKKALLATSQFLKAFPQESQITLIDFDTKPKIVSKGSPAKALQALRKIRANGATALYDALNLGLDMLKDANRPALVLFTDGKDANWNDTGPGSKATAKEVFEKAKQAKVPIFTIGFGNSPDVNTLSRLAALTGGVYYHAADHKALGEVFTRIKENLGHQWRVFYERPKAVPIGHRPVMVLMVDNSGSMEGKIETLRRILHDFLASLPSDFLVQLMTFSNDVEAKQVLTNDKLSLYRALSEMKPLSGTDILGSLVSAYQVLHAVPSSERYLVYITDEALDVSDSEKEKLDLVLQQLKDDGVKTLLVGMVPEDKAEVFSHAAGLAGGTYVVSPDLSRLEQALANLSQEIGNAPKQQGHLVRLVYKHTDQFGRTSLYAAAREVEESLPLAKDGKVQDPEKVSWAKGEKITPYGGELSEFVTGDDVIGKQVQVIKRLPLNVSAENQAVRITLKEAIFLSKLRGVKASGKRFLALTMELVNILKPQEVVVYPDGSAHPAAWVGGASDRNARVVKKIPDYLIPDVRKHFFLSWNNKTSFPVSEATYLAETPLILPGQNEIYLKPGQPVQGTLIFVVPEEFMVQSALHLYDTAYGHIDLPISGILKLKREDIAKLPTKVEGKLSETFSLKIDGFTDQKKLYEVEPEDYNIFRVLEITFVSKVQAHLSVNPSRRFFLAVDTEKGPFIFRLHPVTKRIPLGFYQQRLVTPGSFNKARLVFELPEELASYPSRLLVDLKGGGLSLPLKGEEKTSSPSCQAEAKAKGISLCLNGFYLGEREGEVVADVTLIDEKDDSSTALEEFLALKATPEAQKRLQEQNISLKQGVVKTKGLANFGDNTVRIFGDVFPLFKDYITALPRETLVLNGQARRGFIFFSLPKGTNPADFCLVSPVFKDLSFKIPQRLSPFRFENLLTRASHYEEDETFARDLAKAVARLSEIRKAKGFVKPGTIRVAATTLDGTPPRGLPVEPPSLLLTGGKTWQEVKNLAELKKLLAGVELKASNQRAWTVYYAPEAVLTQGWMTENELAFMVEKVLNRQAIETERVVASLTTKGKEALRKVFSAEEIDLYELPALKFEDDRGYKHTLVIPFLKDAEEIPDYISKISTGSFRAETISLEVELKVRPLVSGQRETLAQITDALASTDEEKLERVVLLSKKISLPLASLGPLSLGFREIIHPQKGRIIKAILDTPEGRVIGEEALELAKYEPVQLRLRFYTPADTYETVRDLGEKEWPTELFFVIGANVPDLPLEKLKLVDSSWSRAYQETRNPDTLSSLKWFGQGVIARFVGAQTEYERELAERLGVEIIRLKQPRLLVLEYRLDQKTGILTRSLDLVQPYPEIRGGEELRKKFNLLAGFYYTDLEAHALPEGINAVKLLSLLPQDTPLLLFAPEDNTEVSEVLRKSGYPRFVWEHFKDSDNFVLFPAKPLILAGNKMRVAWFEIDPETLQVWSFLDTGQRGVVDTQIGEALALSMDYMMGFWMGVQNSVWATAGFSLVLDDWNQIKTCAHGFARRLGEYLAAATDPAGTMKPDAQKAQAGLSGDLAGALGLSGFDYGCMGADKVQQLVREHAESKAWTTEDLQKIVEGSKSLFDIGKKSWGRAKDKYLGFANGYKDGVDWYFK